MIDLLFEAYPRHYGSSRFIGANQIHHCITDLDHFELSDTIPDGICEDGEGMTVFSNPGKRNISILNIEKYIDLFGNNINAGKGLKCDFLVYNSAKEYDNFICVELTKSREKYLHEYRRDDEMQEGKRAKAVNQLKATINKLLPVPAIREWIANFQHKTGLFAFRLSEETDDKNPVTQMNMAFNRFSKEVPALQTAGELPDGFIFSQRKYPATFKV